MAAFIAVVVSFLCSYGAYALFADKDSDENGRAVVAALVAFVIAFVATAQVL